ncbi:PREDICTED: zinc finger CCCH domain-containing protein 48-like [Ipomoea nil]|uniref:zinc finger CCCH domain-containing protein 48-like n=1 Tax=Ipomoea nil TaxID=35883 RepID=UPI000901AD53|nr:PREDICTED: zinc finger CCCH domain-containing protein 48-like [Ipomoea nil]
MAVKTVVKTVHTVSKRPEASVFNRLRVGGRVYNKVCIYWLQGRCNRNPCQFRHSESSLQQPRQTLSTIYDDDRHSVRPETSQRNSSYMSPKTGTNLTNGIVDSGSKTGPGTKKTVSISRGSGSKGKVTQKPQIKLCQYWVTNHCVHGDKCKDLHAWSFGDGFSLLAKLEGHTKAITGIALPSGSNQLFSSSNDKSVRVWDCHSGQCASVIKFDKEVGCLVGEGPWVFVGLPDVVKVWNVHTQIEFNLNGPTGQVYAMTVGNDKLFAGTENGTILAWKFTSEINSPELVSSLEGHNQAVLSLVVGANRLYSGSMDNTIRMWDLESLQCLQTLNGHADVVMSVLCWDNFLLSGSLDNTIKVWAATENGSLEVFYEHKEETGVLALCGICDAEAKPILLCSCNDNTIRLYDLPSFSERGRLFAKREVRSVEIGVGGLFFTGDATGEVSVWKLQGEAIGMAPQVS